MLEDAGTEPVEPVKITSPFNLRQSVRDKETIMDVKVPDSAGRSYDIEIQNVTSAELMERLNYYGSHLYSDQIGESEQYDRLKYCIIICLLRTHIS